MTPAETLREAGRLMRERAQAATPGPWEHKQPEGDWHWVWVAGVPTYAGVAECQITDGSDLNQEGRDAAHIASWHPAVALAVADWLDEEAAWTGQGDDKHALAVARAYLGEAS